MRCPVGLTVPSGEPDMEKSVLGGMPLALFGDHLG